MLEQGLQIVAAVLVLTAFGLAQTHRLSVRSSPYLWLNLVGSGMLATLAAVAEQWGFVLLNTVWGAVSLVGMVRRRRGEPVAPPSSPEPQ